MKTITILFLVICFIACSNDQEVEQSYGTKLILIEYMEGDRNWIENYTYSSNDKLNIVEDFRSLGRRYEIEYQDKQIKEFSTYSIDKNELIFRDSILYNSNGTIQAIYNFSINSGADLPLSTISEFEYNDQNKVSKKSTYFVTIEKYISIEKYYWSENNIEKVAYYNGDEELSYEFFYKYDDKVNYKKEMPVGISNPVNWSDNNVTEMNWIDYSGTLDLICAPCIAKYKYNLNNRPVSIKYNWGRKLILTYDE
ncbi:MAG: hypothetical protein L3J34_06145 [Flavobacteriaceae bacterium]|nr:hypothetical protein [Flavobacteriaceae bacterium]